MEIPPTGAPSGVQSPTGRPPLASPGQAPPPQRSASERLLQPGSATSTPGKAPAPAPVPGAAPGASKGMPIKGDRGRFKVYEVRYPSLRFRDKLYHRGFCVIPRTCQDHECRSADKSYRVHCDWAV